ncbi:unnamed protein product [Rotaria sp. Silwood2]|nr:unnamed protein product [Rotaria sp. Silwood2]
MSSFFNTNYFQAILNLIGNENSTISTLWGIFWQAFYALAGCLIGAVVLGNVGALIGTFIENLTDEIRRTISSPTVDSLLRYAMNSNDRQFIFNIIQRFLNNQQTHNQNINPGLFSRLFS